jgi:tryptophanyl-tRNA synthetase
VRRFNYLYKKEVFPEPQAVYSKAQVLPWYRWQEKSKSYGIMRIPFGAGPEEMKERIRLMVTDPKRIKKTDKGNPVCVRYSLSTKYSTQKISEDIACQCRNAEIGCVQCKNCLC